MLRLIYLAVLIGAIFFYSYSSRSAAAKLFTQLHIERWAFDVELIYLAEQQHFSLAEVAVQWTEIDGSKVTPILSWLQMGRK
jgi:dolichyl-phosphate beta-glucosyltransferase